MNSETKLIHIKQNTMQLIMSIHNTIYLYIISFRKSTTQTSRDVENQLRNQGGALYDAYQPEKNNDFGQSEALKNEEAKQIAKAKELSKPKPK